MRLSSPPPLPLARRTDDGGGVGHMTTAQVLIWLVLIYASVVCLPVLLGLGCSVLGTVLGLLDIMRAHALDRTACYLVNCVPKLFALFNMPMFVLAALQCVVPVNDTYDTYSKALAIMLALGVVFFFLDELDACGYMCAARVRPPALPAAA